MNQPSGNPFKPGFGAQPEPAAPTEIAKTDPEAQPPIDNAHVKPGCEKFSQSAAVNAEIIALKELRRDIDIQLQKLKSLATSRARSLSITKIQEAVMWLGMALKEINDERPYPSSYDPSTTKIEPTADGLKL